MAKKRNQTEKYRKERSPLVVVLYILAVIALIGCIVFFLYEHRIQQSEYEDTVYQASLTETEMLITEREEETETETETESESETETETETESEEAVSEEAALSSSSADSTSQVNPYAPVLVLNSNIAVISQGDSFDPLSCIESITDDSDNIYTLWRNIHVDGSYNSSIPGIYQLFIYAVDSSGNSSNREMFLLEVQETETETETESDSESALNLASDSGTAA